MLDNEDNYSKYLTDLELKSQVGGTSYYAIFCHPFKPINQPIFFHRHSVTPRK